MPTATLCVAGTRSPGVSTQRIHAALLEAVAELGELQRAGSESTHGSDAGSGSDALVIDVSDGAPGCSPEDFDFATLQLQVTEPTHGLDGLASGIVIWCTVTVFTGITQAVGAWLWEEVLLRAVRRRISHPFVGQLTVNVYLAEPRPEPEPRSGSGAGAGANIGSGSEAGSGPDDAPACVDVRIDATVQQSDR